MFQSVEIVSPTLNKVATRFQTGAADFHSIFFRAAKPWPFYSDYPNFSRGDAVVLMEVLNSDFLRASIPQLFPLDQDKARKYSVLNRLEFEGSLIHLLLQGTCTERVVASESEARETVLALLAETILRSDDSLCAFRMDDKNWSELTRGATISGTYFVYAPFTRPGGSLDSRIIIDLATTRTNHALQQTAATDESGRCV